MRICRRSAWCRSRAPGRVTGFDPAQFLGAQGSDELATIDAAAVRELVQDSFEHTPILVGGSERIQRYLIWENELENRGADPPSGSCSSPEKP